MKTYIILQLILNAATGEPLEVSQYSPTIYREYDECLHVVLDIPPQPTKDGKAVIYSCATDKQTEVL